jgi:hypothetical protein
MRVDTEFLDQAAVCAAQPLHPRGLLSDLHSIGGARRDRERVAAQQRARGRGVLDVAADGGDRSSRTPP